MLLARQCRCAEDASVVHEAGFHDLAIGEEGRDRGVAGGALEGIHEEATGFGDLAADGELIRREDIDERAHADAEISADLLERLDGELVARFGGGGDDLRRDAAKVALDERPHLRIARAGGALELVLGAPDDAIALTIGFERAIGSRGGIEAARLDDHMAELGAAGIAADEHERAIGLPHHRGRRHDHAAANAGADRDEHEALGGVLADAIAVLAEGGEIGVIAHADRQVNLGLDELLERDVFPGDEHVVHLAAEVRRPSDKSGYVINMPRHGEPDRGDLALRDGDGLADRIGNGVNDGLGALLGEGGVLLVLAGRRTVGKDRLGPDIRTAKINADYATRHKQSMTLWLPLFGNRMYTELGTRHENSYTDIVGRLSRWYRLGAIGRSHG